MRDSGHLPGRLIVCHGFVTHRFVCVCVCVCALTGPFIVLTGLVDKHGSLLRKWDGKGSESFYVPITPICH